MQIIDPLDPMMLLVYGLVIAILFLIFATRFRRSKESELDTDNISDMISGRVEEVSTNIQEPIPPHIDDVEEE